MASPDAGLNRQENRTATRPPSTDLTACSLRPLANC
jgi:hypothetical protein